MRNVALRSGGRREPARAAATLVPARLPVQRPVDARVLVVAGDGALAHRRRADWIDALHDGDLVIANDAATLPASLQARHVRTGLAVEVRLAAHAPRAGDGALRFDAVAFGAGDWRTRTEERALPPPLAVGDELAVGRVALVIDGLLDHPRLVRLRFPRDDALAWSLLAHGGRPVQYAHLAVPLAPWDVATAIASRPFAFEAPSAGFALDWRTLHALRERGISFATLTHAAGLSSTGDPALDARLPLPEPYELPAATVRVLERTQNAGGRVVAIGTTVVRALEHAAHAGPVRPGRGLADQRIGPDTRLRVVDGLLTGTHEPGTSHYELLRAFAADQLLARLAAELAAHGYRTHEYGDSVLLLRGRTQENPR